MWIKWHLSFRRMFIVIGVFFALLVSETKGLKCQDCSDHWNDPTNCTKVTNDKTIVCTASVKTCMLATGTRPEPGKGKLTPGMTRRCSEPNEKDHIERWNAAIARGYKMICYMQQIGSNTDRTCICGEDNCNKQNWDEVMVQPVLEANQSVTGNPMFPTLGVNSLDKIISGTSPTIPLKPPETSTTLPMSSSSASMSNGTATLSNGTSISNPAESGGLGTGMLVGLAVGGLLLMGLIGFGIYWFKFRKRTERASADTGASGGSADTDVSGEDD